MSSKLLKWENFCLVAQSHARGDRCQLVRQADLLATFADLLGSKVPGDIGEDSFGLLPLLKGDDSPVRDYHR